MHLSLLGSTLFSWMLVLGRPGGSTHAVNIYTPLYSRFEDYFVISFHAPLPLRFKSKLLHTNASHIVTTGQPATKAYMSELVYAPLSESDNLEVSGNLIPASVGRCWM